MSPEPKLIRWTNARSESIRNGGKESFDGLLKDIKEQQKPCVFIQPHFDDVPLSCAELVGNLSKSLPDKVFIVTVFTKADESVHNWRRSSFLPKKETSVEHYYSQRVEEDNEACKALGAVPIRLSFTDGAWRKIEHPSILQTMLHPDGIVPMYGMTFFNRRGGKISSHDQPLIPQIGEALKKTIESEIGTDTDYVLFAPLAVKGKITHVDHTITRQAVANAFSDKTVIYYGDYPYLMRNEPDKSFIQQHDLVPALYSGGDQTQKRQSVTTYQSQLHSLFKDSLVPLSFPPEVYFVKKSR